MQHMAEATGLLPATQPPPSQASFSPALVIPPLAGLAYLKSSASGAWAVAMGSVAVLSAARLWRRLSRKGRDTRGGVKRDTSPSRAGLRRGASWDPFHNRPTPGAPIHMQTIQGHDRGSQHLSSASAAPEGGQCLAPYRLGVAARGLCPRSCRRHAPHRRAAATVGTHTPHVTRAAPLGPPHWLVKVLAGRWRGDCPSAHFPRDAPASPPRCVCARLGSSDVLVQRGPVHALDGQPLQGSACSGTHPHTYAVKATRTRPSPSVDCGGAQGGGGVVPARCPCHMMHRGVT